LPTRNLSWWRAWVFLGVVLVGAAASTLSVRRASRALLEERFKSPVQEGQPLADKIIVILLITAFVGVIAFIPLDVFRLHLMARPNRFVSAAGLILFVAGWWVMTLALRANPFAAPVVKHQADRRQVAIDSGLYRLVRHPMYAGAIMLFVGMPLWLESYAATLLAGIPAGLLVLRIHIEERFLRRELPGYDVYARRVRYRLFPRLW
jgi:protein-S-isoprenylcysteine O-methyltransferase Ste14